MNTNTIPNVPRELLERLRSYIPNGDGYNSQYANDLADAAEAIERLSAPSPAGVDGLDVVAYLIGGEPSLTPCRVRGVVNEPLCRPSDAQAIIDGLRGEVALLQRAEKNDAIAYKAALERQDELRTERDQQARRIGELEGLLRDSAELIKHGVFEDGYCCCGSSVDSHGLGDGHSPVDALAYHAGQVCERIDAALSAVCAAAPNIATTSEHSGS